MILLHLLWIGAAVVGGWMLLMPVIDWMEDGACARTRELKKRRIK